MRDLLAELTTVGFVGAELVAFTGVATSERTVGAIVRARKPGH